MAPPGGVNLLAFLSRFQNTCWSRAKSPLERARRPVQRDREPLAPGLDVGRGNFHGALDGLV